MLIEPLANKLSRLVECKIKKELNVCHAGISADEIEKLVDSDLDRIALGIYALAIKERWII